MTTAQAAKLIGQEAIWNAGNGLSFQVLIEDVKIAYGNTRYQVKPVSGQGSTWVQSGLEFISLEPCNHA